MFFYFIRDTVVYIGHEGSDQDCIMTFLLAKQLQLRLLNELLLLFNYTVCLLQSPKSLFR